MNMKNTLKISFATISLCALAALPLRAQTKTPTETGMTNAAVTNTISQAPINNSQAAQSPSVRVDAPPFHFNGEDIKESLAVMIPIIAIVMGCGIPIVIVGLQLYFRHRKNIVLHETLRTMVEKGVPIPPEMFKKTEREFMEHDKPKSPRNDLRTGLILTCMGIGLILFIGKAGCIMLLLGVAFLVLALVDRKNKNDGQPPKV
jgi:beta-lactamase regulating signal transducer with metallopeptidase domain